MIYKVYTSIMHDVTSVEHECRNVMITLFAFLLFERIVRCVSYSAFANMLAVIYTIDVYIYIILIICSTYT